MIQDFLQLQFNDKEYDFVHDIGCFNHVKPKDRTTFIKGIRRILKKGDNYMLTCFSYRNGRSWNYFTKKRLINLFSPYFHVGGFRHYLQLRVMGQYDSSIQF